ncbi:hypothetical protein [Pseudotabrizicola alkalilacus]|uniref:hypothetical protein n=1 Tax=Pseudotabrizicola alkalilacus TaxID=2305252 RepID=UPI0011C0F76D|nr:hypothetical protein [Pseudotabrizicola alkalilacus]
MGRRTALSIGLRAFGLGLVAALVLPMMIMFSVLGISHLAGGCGAGSSGGCEMGAASLGLIAILPCFVIGVGVSLYLDLWRDRG